MNLVSLAELLTEAGMFKVQLEKWLSDNYPALLG
jgi:hypothetical protein